MRPCDPYISPSCINIQVQLILTLAKQSIIRDKIKHMSVISMVSCIKVISITVGLLLLVNAVFMAIVANMSTGVLFVAIAGAFFLLYSIYYTRIKSIKWLHYTLIGSMLCASALIAFLAVYGRVDTVTYEEDALVVLGAAIRGETPSYPLYMRLESAISYHIQNPTAIIIVSGGQGFQEDITEARAMERYLMSRGVPEEMILKEELSTSTYENFLYSKAMLDSHFDRPYQIAFVTSDFHVFRAANTAAAIGYTTTHIHAPIRWYSIPTNYLRECVAVMRDLFFHFVPNSIVNPQNIN